MIVHASRPPLLKESACSDCGRISERSTPFMDPQTQSEVALCPNCAMAFAQRQQFPPGCCD